MPKDGEIAYLKNIGLEDEANVWHAAHKPFSDQDRGGLLMRFGAVLQLLPPPPARVLDMGCGTGWTSRFLAQSGYQVVGVDICSDMIEVANQQYCPPSLDLTFLIRDYEQLDFHEEFAAVVFFDSLHHAEDEHLALRKTYTALVPGGVCVTSEPGEGHSDHPVSRSAMERFGVTEKDMPPKHIFQLAQEIGFARMNAYPMPESNLLIPYEAEPAQPPDVLPRAAWKRLIVRAFLRRYGLGDDRLGRVVHRARCLASLPNLSAVCRLVK